MADQTTTTTMQMSPEMRAAYLTNADYARNVANQMGQRQFAGFNPQYQAGEQLIQGAYGGTGMQNLGTAADLTRAAAGYAPMGIGPNQAMTQGYYNPFQQDVVNASLADIERARQSAIGQTGQQATAARAFGGSRHGVAESLTNQGFAQQAANTAANLRSQGFQNAQQMAQQAMMANQGAGLQGAQLRLGAANQLGNLGQMQTAQQYAAGQAMLGLGGARQQMAQQQMDAARNLGAERLGVMQSALGLQMPNLGYTSTSTAPLYQNQGASALGGALAGYQMFGPWGALGGGLLGLMG